MRGLVGKPTPFVPWQAATWSSAAWTRSTAATCSTSSPPFSVIPYFDLAVKLGWPMGRLPGGGDAAENAARGFHDTAANELIGACRERQRRDDMMLKVPADCRSEGGRLAPQSITSISSFGHDHQFPSVDAYGMVLEKLP